MLNVTRKCSDSLTPQLVVGNSPASMHDRKRKGAPAEAKSRGKLTHAAQIKAMQSEAGPKTHTQGTYISCIYMSNKRMGQTSTLPPGA
jgi:hypothetical protein